MKIKLDQGARVPTRAHRWDAGLDLYAREGQMLCPGGGKLFDTGVHMEIPRGMVGLLLPRSGLNVRQDLSCLGVIDAGYTGSIAVKLYNHGPDVQYINAGDRIAQLVLVPCALPEPEMAEALEDTERGESGFGSSGR